MKRTRVFAVALLAAYFSSIVEIHAETASCAPIHRANLVRCALDGSLVAKAERHNAEIAEARQEAARTVLPANPVLEVSAGRRTTTGVTPAINWYVTLSQEIEIGGQRSARQRVAGAEREAQEKWVTKTDREVAARAWFAYFEALAAKEEARLAERLEVLLEKVANATRSASESGVVSGVDADVAEATHLRATQERISAIQHERVARSTLLTQIGLLPNAAIAIDGELIPLAEVESFAAKQDARTIADRPEVQALEATGRAYVARGSLFRRSRIPNPTFGVFIQDDGFHERVIGAQISLPIPLPHPVGHTNAGEIAEAEASARRARTDAERAAREIELKLSNARTSFSSAKAQYELYTAERLERTNQSLLAIAAEIEAGRLSIRDAIAAESALVEVLRAALETKKNFANASVELAIAAGYPLEKVTQ